MGATNFGRYLIASCGAGSVLYGPSVILNPERLDVADHVRVDSFVKLEAGLGMRIGPCVHVASFCHVGIGGGYTILGDRAMVASGAKILSGTNTMDGRSMSSAAPREEQVIKRMTTVIDDGAFIGAGAIVLPGLTVGKRAVVGAGAVVTKNIPAGEVWVGNPAHHIGYRPTPTGGDVGDFSTGTPVVVHGKETV
jgi:UDP-2-acetamido-3-amino-2,3-dideoxy-glucuronate N-acetyltransferase